MTICNVTEERDARADLRRAEIYLNERKANPGDRTLETLAVIERVSKRAKDLRIALAGYEARRRKALAMNWDSYPCRWRQQS